MSRRMGPGGRLRPAVRTHHSGDAIPGRPSAACRVIGRPMAVRDRSSVRRRRRRHQASGTDQSRQATFARVRTFARRTAVVRAPRRRDDRSRLRPCCRRSRSAGRRRGPYAAPPPRRFDASCRRGRSGSQATEGPGDRTPTPTRAPMPTAVPEANEPGPPALRRSCVGSSRVAPTCRCTSCAGGSRSTGATTTSPASCSSRSRSSSACRRQEGASPRRAPPRRRGRLRTLDGSADAGRCRRLRDATRATTLNAATRVAWITPGTSPG